MTIPAAPTVPVPTSSTFATDAYAFTQWQAELGPAIDAETARLNALAFGSYNATSTTSLTVGTGSKSLTVDTGKGYAVGQAVMIASTAGPTNYLTGQVTSYDSGTGALVVNVTSVAGSGTVAAWTVSVSAVVAGGGVSPYSIVVLTSGTSWTCPAGVTRAVLTVVGGCGGGGSATSTGGPGGGGAGGFARAIVSLTPATSYTYSIGGAGSAGPAGGAGGTGGNSTFVIASDTFTGAGGLGGGGSTSSAAGQGGAGGGGTAPYGVSGYGATGTGGDTGASNIAGEGGVSIIGTKGGNNSAAGEAGKIVLELYK